MRDCIRNPQCGVEALGQGAAEGNTDIHFPAARRGPTRAGTQPRGALYSTFEVSKIPPSRNGWRRTPVEHDHLAESMVRVCAYDRSGVLTGLKNDGRSK
ncbi:hypothetical protein [Lysobacter sp. TY2-98]|uniref:hypothetical protein n=1 Tax=Lysobacter sp. TY2-98 TaxID=2290922 RepID=UPI0013B43690|nr:hypothetical protein [Lysobacter sp. TY2-98]